MDSTVATSTAAALIDWHNYIAVVANSFLPDLVKITFELVLIPVIGLLARVAASHSAKWYMKFLVKWAGQKVQRGVEEWAEKRLSLVVEAARKTWWLKWVTTEELHMMIEAAVAEWKKEFEAETGRKH